MAPRYLQLSVFIFTSPASLQLDIMGLCSVKTITALINRPI